MASDTLTIEEAAQARPGKGGVLRLLYVLYYGSGAAWSPFLSVYLRQVGLSGLQIGLLSGIRPAMVLLSQPLWGVAADLRGRRRTLLLTMPLAAILLLGYIWPGGFWFFLAWTVLYALLSSPVGSLIDSLVLDHLEQHPNLSYGRLRLWGAVGWALSSFAIGRAIAGQDIRLVFVYAAAFMLLGWLVAWRGTRGQGGHTPLAGERTWRGAGALFRNRRLVVLLALITFLQLGAASINTFYPIYMSELGASRPLIGTAYTLQGLSELPLYLLAAALIRRFKSGRVIALTFLVFAARMFAYSVIRAPHLAMMVEACHGFSFSLLLVASVDYINRLVPREWRATGQALFWAAYSGAGSILGNAWAGMLYDRLGVQGMFRANAALALAIAVAAVFLLREPANRSLLDSQHSDACYQGTKNGNIARLQDVIIGKLEARAEGRSRKHETDI